MLKLEDLKIFNLNADNKILEFLIELTAQKIKNFCNIDEVPKELEKTQKQMCIDLYDLRYKNNNIANNIDENEIKNIKRGNTQIEFCSNIDKINNEKQLIKELINNSSFLFNYEDELLDFRCLKF